MKLLTRIPPEYHQQDLEESAKAIFSSLILTICIMLALTVFIIGVFETPGHTQDINLDIIADIESNSNPVAYNEGSGAIGEYQITAIVLQDFNEQLDQHYKVEEMYKTIKSHIVANWYVNYRIPDLLNYYNIPDNLTSRLIAYNWGIRGLKHWFKNGSHWNRLPIETRRYIKKYYRKLKGNN